MKFRIGIMACISVICLLALMATVFGKVEAKGDEHNKGNTRLIKLEQTIAELYEQGNASHKQEVYRLVQSLKHQLNEPELLQQGTVNAWTMMREDVLTVEKALVNKESGIVWREPINRLRLAVDSLMQAEQGPWLQYEALLLDDIQSIRRVSQSKRENKVELTNIYVEKLMERIERMEMAAYMVGDEKVMSQLLKRSDMLQHFISSHKDGWNQSQHKSLVTLLDGMELTVHALFAMAEETITVPAVTAPANANATSFALFIGAIISAFLAFAGYRKYKQEPYGVKNWRI
ncbi:sporulation protein YpjB [Paenibacillus camelliae]|uniref:sporulation protein YpjB n=1 Tax=Paenibacillus camelliae TaxID=512410 RepID=UPI00203F290E|nr:sporulation protein YpjB [Paenibacillus camelliae]MCM3633042.1 sporulation protein YpjB [Paenibacillus camelliae]